MPSTCRVAAGRALLLTFALIARAAGAQSPAVTAPLLATPPSLERFAAAMSAGVVPDTTMASIDGFVDRVPRDGMPASQRTSVYLGRDATALYVVFLCYADDPASVRAHLVTRDRIYDADDSVAVQIDTFRDFRRAYGFQANFAGAKQDGYWIEGSGWSLDADFDYDVEGTRTTRGYAMKFTIPFSSMDYTAGTDTWG